VAAPRDTVARMPDGATVVPLFTDFDPEWALGFLSARCVPSLESVTPGVYARGIRIGRRRVTMECRFPTSPSGARRLLIRSSPALPPPDLRHLASRLFDLDTDLGPFRRLARRDGVLRRLAPLERGLRVLQFLDPFEALARAILGQQVSLAGARTLADRLVRLLAPPSGGPVVFPTAAHVADVSPQTLRRLGLTRSRAHTLHTAARAVSDGVVRLEALRDLPTEEAEATLRALPGIGPWTASYVLMRGLGHPDAFPRGDLGIQKALEAACGPRLRPARVVEIAERWRPWRAYATLHLWDSISGAADA
jgi:AraC family transcriptional regulator, regulatory protein of adaptative response / DNA-3-methyladenine glycosylase II